MIPLARFNRIVDLALSCPQTVLKPAASLLLATVALEPGQLLRVRWLSAKLVRLSAASFPLKVNSSLGLAYVGVYSGDFSDVSRPGGTPLALLSLNFQTKRLNPYYFRDFTAPDTYSVFAVNNTQNLDLDLVVSGAARLYLDHA
jgi:hypothetical protein